MEEKICVFCKVHGQVEKKNVLWMREFPAPQIFTCRSCEQTWYEFGSLSGSLVIGAVDCEKLRRLLKDLFTPVETLQSFMHQGSCYLALISVLFNKEEYAKIESILTRWGTLNKLRAVRN